MRLHLQVQSHSVTTISKQTFSVPIRLEVGIKKKKMYYINLNGYRNWAFQLNNSLKKTFKFEVAEEVKQLTPIEGKCRVSYDIYYPTRRVFDIDNIGSVITKFTHDALVEFGILEDDNYNIVTEITYRFGGVDKDNPRCDVTIEECNEDD
jgi:Holliday junction resolvase RusA-like endonuclease